MSSLNPVVGVSICIGALGAGLAYLAYTNTEEEVVQIEEENNSLNKDNKESKDDDKKDVKEEVKEEVKKELDNNIETQEKTKMQEYLKKTYDNIQDFN